MEKHFSYSSEKQLWRILISDTDKLILENRNPQTKEVFFQCYDLQSGKIIFNDFQHDEKNWIGIETIYKDIIYFHVYPQRDLPGHKEIIAFDLASQKILWHNKELTFLFADNNRIYGFVQGFEDRFFYSLDFLTGEILEEYKNNYSKINLMKKEADSKKDWSFYIYPEIKKLNEFIYNNELSNYLLNFPIVGEIEEIEIDNKIILSFHTKEDDQTLTNHFIVYNKYENTIIIEEILNRNAKSFLTDSFFIYKNFLFVLKEKNGVDVYFINHIRWKMDLTNEEKIILLNAARSSIKSQFEKIEIKKPNYEKHPLLKTKSGAFVTITINKTLRGCIGFIISNKKLFETVCDAAIQAAFHDPRFYPLQKDEFEKISLEISVLSEPFPLKSYDEIILGVHGLIIEEYGRRGLLLPQVPIEHKMSKDEYLDSICLKAGLPKNLWKEKQVNLSGFTATVFSDDSIKKGNWKWEL